MMDIAKPFLQAIAYLQSLGSTIFVSIMLFITAICFRLPFAKSIRASLTVGVGFIGVNLVLDIVWDVLAPLAQQLSSEYASTLTALDVSWPAAAAIAFSTRIGAVIIPVIMLVNIVMLLLKWTKTVNIDVWNYWHYALFGSLVTVMTQSLFLGFLAAACHSVITLKYADLTAYDVQRELSIPGISIPHGSSASFVPIFLLLDKVYDHFSIFDIHDDEKKEIQNPILKFLSEPIVLGGCIGAMMAVVAGYDFLGVTKVAMGLAALMVLLPQMVRIIMEGLVPISHAAKRFMGKRFLGREFYIGLDSAIALGHPTTIKAAAILIPVTIILAFAIPGNSTIPAGDLVAINFFIVLATPIHRGNLLRTLTSGTIVIGLMLLISSYFAPAYTQLAVQVGGVELANQMTMISSMIIGNGTSWMLSQLVTKEIIGGVLMVGFTIGFVLLLRWFEMRSDLNRKTEEQLAE